MSVVVAIKQDGKVFIGADSQVTRGGTRSSLSNPNNYKVWKVNGINNCLMAHVGSVRDACAVRVMGGLVDELAVIHDDINFEYVVEYVFPRIVNRLKEFKYLEDRVFDFLESRFLFAFKDKLFVLSNDGSVLEVDDCVAIGSGESEAIGSLITTGGEASAQDRIIKAIKSSAAHDIYVDYPIILTDTETTDFTVLDEELLKKREASKNKRSTSKRVEDDND